MKLRNPPLSALFVGPPLPLSPPRIPLAHAAALAAGRFDQGGEDVADEPVREQAIFDAVQGDDRGGLFDEGHHHRGQARQPAG